VATHTQSLQGRSGLSDYRSPLSAAIAGGIRTVYQPIVRLSDRRPIGYEALARGPRGSELERPDLLFAAATAEGRAAELDWECWRRSLKGACDGGLNGGATLFVNVEPSSASAWVPEAEDDLLAASLSRFPLVVELTERALTAVPTELMRLVDGLRERGARIALDDVGTDPRSLALMPFIRPDVIKLDLKLMQGRPTPAIAEVVQAVAAEAERTGAQVLAEGIETEEHLQRALALGAVYGQGWLFGRPGELRPDDVAAASLPLPRAVAEDASRTPFEIVTAERPLRRGDKRLLLQLTRSIEEQAAKQGPATVILSTFQEAPFFTAKTARRYVELARDAALVGALGVGLATEPAPGIRGVSLDAAEPLRGEWDVAVLGPHFAAAFVARDLGDAGTDFDRRFDFCMTHDRDLATTAARTMMRRIAAADPTTAALAPDFWDQLSVRSRR
jgi:EAL domain-containing protein (putative c-di-GMP-specific phosphodiesterase class I)